MNTHDLAHQLARALSSSDEYRGFIQAKGKVKGDSGNTKLLAEFQIKQFEIQQQQMMGQSISTDKQQELESMYSLLSLNPTVKEYLEAEFRFNSLVNDIQKILADSIQEAVPIMFEQE